MLPKGKILLSLSLIALSVLSCADSRTLFPRKDAVMHDLDSIRARGKIIAVTDNSSTNYFIYRGEPMGFQYELLRHFSNHAGIDFEIVTENNPDKAFSMLHTGEADLIAMGLTVNSSRRKKIRFTAPIGETRQVLVQRKPDGWREMTCDSVEQSLIRDQCDLGKRTIYVQQGSSHVARLKAISDIIGKSVRIIKVPLETEILIQMVGSGEIDYTVCDENIALVNSNYYPDIDVSTPVSYSQDLAWAVRKTHSDQLLEELNSWITEFTKTSTYAILYAKYYKNSRSDRIFNSEYFALSTGKISQWDDIIKVYSDSIKWDWRLLASLICQESRFNPTVTSWAGAYGLMQIMPETGQNFGIDIRSSPNENIKAGTMYIRWLHTIFDTKIDDPEERTRFILAAYNAGPGHVLDAMRLAEKNGKDPGKWNGHVAEWLLRKSEPEYLNDEMVKYGYLRGREPIAFVNNVLDRYQHYRNIVP